MKILDDGKNNIIKILFLILNILIILMVYVNFVHEKRTVNEDIIKLELCMKKMRKNIDSYERYDMMDLERKRHVMLEDKYKNMEEKYKLMLENRNIPKNIKEEMENMYKNFFMKSKINDMYLLEEKKKYTIYGYYVDMVHLRFCYYIYVYKSLKLIYEIYNNGMEGKKKEERSERILCNTDRIIQHIVDINEKENLDNMYRYIINKVEFKILIEEIRNSIEGLYIQNLELFIDIFRGK